MEMDAACVLWSNDGGTPLQRAAYFRGLRRLLPADEQHFDRPGPEHLQAKCLADLMMIRALHSHSLSLNSFGTAVGYRITDTQLTESPAVIVFVPRKVHPNLLRQDQLLPRYLEGCDGVWCDVDVVEFSFSEGPCVEPREQAYDPEVDGLRGNSAAIGPGSQVSSPEMYGTLGALVRSRTGDKRLGFITNRKVAVDLDYPVQKMYHPVPPSIGPAVYLGAVERAMSFASDDMWYGVFVHPDPATFVRVDAAFVPFAPSCDISMLTNEVPGIERMGEVLTIDIQGDASQVIGLEVMKVGHSSGPTSGKIMGYSMHYNDSCLMTDFLVVGGEDSPFDLDGDNGSILVTRAVPARPLGMIWGGTCSKGRLKLKPGSVPRHWTSVVDLGRILKALELDPVLSAEALVEEVC